MFKTFCHYTGNQDANFAISDPENHGVHQFRKILYIPEHTVYLQTTYSNNISTTPLLDVKGNILVVRPYLRFEASDGPDLPYVTRLLWDLCCTEYLKKSSRTTSNIPNFSPNSIRHIVEDQDFYRFVKKQKEYGGTRTIAISVTPEKDYFRYCVYLELLLGESIREAMEAYEAINLIPTLIVF